MLPQADVEIVARDVALPGLRFVLDAGALTKELRMAPMIPLYLRYKPGTSCVAALAAPDGSRVVAVMAYTRAHYMEVRNRREWREGPDPAVFHDDACLVVVPLARDRKLKGARLITNAEDSGDFLKNLVGDETGASRLLRYKAGRRLVVQIGDVRPRALVKAYSKSNFPAALEGARIAQMLGGAPVLGLSTRRHCLAWPWLAGTPLCPEEGGRSGPAEWRAAGQALALIHQASPRPQATITRADELAALAALATDLPQLSADLTHRATPLIEAVAAGLVRTPFQPCLIHGDFSADQVLVHEGRATIIDWDRAATGDPARDIGSLLARLDVQALDGAELAGLAEIFRDCYAGAGGPATEGLEFQHARALLALTNEGFRQRRPDWSDRAARLLARVADILGMEKITPGKPMLPEKPMLNDARDPAMMAPLLKEILPSDILALEVDLLRHKPGRRALLRYRINTADGFLRVLGKLRAKGADKRTPTLHAALRARGLDGSAPFCVGIPAVRGSIAAPALWLQDEVAGQPLTDLLRPGADIVPAARTGAALARLHKANVPAGRSWTMADELDVLTRALTAARAALPEQGARIDTIARAATEIVQRSGPIRPTGIHRDFYPDQVLIDAERVWLLDFDLYANGDPTIDVANFLAHLDEDGLRNHGDATALSAHGAAFLEGYEDVNPGTDRSRITALRFVSLARHINLSRVIAGRGHVTLALINHCTTYAAKCPANRSAVTRW
ncbi:MAG: phosphotransferase [Rhodobacterales bacterium]|nr:phosphotransferase [Rhodobacterales bacterium]